ncbi:MAG: NAD(P)H-dependent amine dehydrogenase family protein [Limisphaerales bacterium]
MKIKVAQFGLGPIGIETVKLAATKPWLEIVGGVDIDPAKIGKPLSELTGIKSLNKAKVYSSFADLLKKTKPDCVLHTSVSRMPQAAPQLEPIIKAGISVVSSCEELLFPQLRAPAIAKKLDALCRKHKSRVLGTGVNPGFVMDTLAICLTGVCRNVESIEINRVVNASLRRLPLQMKIGSGMDPAEFRRLFREGKMGHVGLVESLALVAHALDWKIGKITETCEPMIAPKNIKTQFLEVPKGLTCGIHHRAEAKAGKHKLTLDLKMYLDAEDPRDAVNIIGDPPIDAVLRGGVHGDRATVAALVNAVPTVLRAQPGLLLMTDVPVPRAG